MTEMRRLCGLLSEDPSEADRYHRLLRWFGFRGFTVGIQSHLAYLIELEQPFRHLANLYPNLKPACDAMCLARSIQERLTSVLRQQNATGASEWREQNDGTRSLEPNQYPLPLTVPAAVSTVPMALLMYAASYLLVRIWDGHAKVQPSCYRVIWKFGAGEWMEDLWGSGGEPHIAMEGQTIVGAIEYILPRAAIKESEGASQIDSWRPWPAGQNECQGFHELLNHTDLTDLFHPTLVSNAQLKPDWQQSQDINQKDKIHDDPDDDRHGQRRIRDSHQLDDRELLPECTYALTEAEHGALFCCLQPADSVRSNDIVLREHTVRSMAGCLATIALVTANTIDAAAKLHCFVQSECESTRPTGLDWRDRALTMFYGTDGLLIKTIWQPYAPNSPSGQAPELALKPLRLGLTKMHRDCVLDELSPIPIDEIIDEIRQVLAKQVHRTPIQVDRCIKHMLARKIFSATANRAIIKHVCAHRPEQNEADPRTSEPIGTDSLSSYIHPNSKAVHQAYQRATKQILFPFSQSSTVKRKVADTTVGVQWIASQDMIRIVQWLAQQATSQATTDPIKLHNNFVIYVAAMLVAATGHRRTKALFPFLFTLDLEDMLAFIADKILAGSEARFVPLIELVVQQLREYEAHLLWLIDQLKRTEPQLADDIRESIGMRPHRRHVAPKLQTGLLFRIRRGRPVPISTAAVDGALERAAIDLGLSAVSKVSTKILRRNIATHLADEGTSGMVIEMLLGHNGDQHAFGAASSWIPQQQFDALRPSIDRYMQQHAWKALPAPWAKSYRGQFKPVLPSLDLSDQAYEGRAIAATEARIRARQAILDALPIEFLGDDQTIDFDDDDVNKIRKRIRDQSQSDEGAQKATLQVLAAYLAQWQNDQRYVAPRTDLIFPRHFKNNRRGDTQEKTEVAIGNVGAQTQVALEAIQRAAIATLPQSKLRGGRAISLDDGMVAKIRTQIEQDLEGDPAAKTKVLSEFAALSKTWRRSGKYRISAASINLSRFTPGPVDICFPRHLAIAKVVVNELPQAIEEALSAATVNTEIRLGAIMLLMVVSEAVLNLEELKQVMLELQGQSLLRFAGQLHVRARLSSAAVIYDRTVDLNFKTAAAVLGYLKCKKLDDVVQFEHIENAANRILSSTIRPMGTMTLRRLLRVMRPYWFLRLPASVYSTVVGGQECNAPSENSIKLLLGSKPPAIEVPRPNARAAKPNKDAELKRALKITRDFLKQAKGTFEKCEGASRSQRKRLRDQLNQKADPQLFELCTRHQIVELWVGFLYYLLEVGGLRVDTYSFNTLTTFQSNLMEELYTVAWDLDLLEMDAQQLRNFYERVLNEIGPQQRNAAKTPFERFLVYLHQWWGTPHFETNLKTATRQRVARSVLMPTRLIDQAMNLAARPDGNNSTIGTVGAALLATNYAFGLRTKEGFGIKHGDFSSEQAEVLRLRRNPIRSLKTFERTIPICLTDPSARKLVRARIAASNDYRAGAKAALFGMPGQPDQLYDYGRVTTYSSWAIKTATGDPEATIYTLRHSYANAVMSHMLMPKPQASSISIELAKSQALPSNALRQLANCQPDVQLYPFQIDRLALWMGQSGTGTLSTSYWHGAWWVASEYCGREALKSPWTSRVMGALLGVESSGFRKRLPSLTDNGSAKDGTRCAVAVETYVRDSQVALLADDSSIDTHNTEELETASTLPAQKMLDGLLMLRRHQGGDFSELARSAESALHVSGNEASMFYEGYTEVGSATEFLDFEPASLREGEFKTLRVDGGQARRRRLLDLIFEQMKTSEEFAKTTNSVVRDWTAEVNGKRPLLVSRGVNDLKRHINWLVELGYEPSNLRLHCFKFQEEQWREVQALDLPMKTATHRLSRSFKIGYLAEYGIEVVQSRTLPNLRELQRVLFALACASAAGLMQMGDVTKNE